MTDIYTRQKRSQLMARVQAKNTKPELVVRRMLHGLGCRFRLHRGDLPGRPDIVLAGRKIAIFVHGCFWHLHQNCSKAAYPTSNTAFWYEKLGANVRRDQVNAQKLMALGWRVLVVWECETKNAEELQSQLRDLAA